MKYYYNDYLVELSTKFLTRLNDIKADYNFDYGDEFEIAICEILRTFLPTKFGICRGFVVSRNGEKFGDDIVIYDQLNFPTLKTNSRYDFSRKENVPIEAVYAYIEAKYTLESENFNKSLLQLSNVKKLCLSREKTDIYQVDPCIGTYRDRGNIVESLPKFRNPILGIILSRYCVGVNNKKTENTEEIKQFLKSKYDNIPDNNTAPELVIAGKDNLLTVGYKKENESVPTLFYPDNGLWIGYENLIKVDLVYGIFLSHLMASLNWIRLGQLPWIDMLNEAKLE